MARHKVAKCRPGYCIQCCRLSLKQFPWLLRRAPNLAWSSTGWQTRGTEGDGKAKDVGGMAASNYYRERGGPRRMKEGRLHDTISVLHVCLRPWLHVALLPCNLTSSILGAPSPRSSPSTHVTSFFHWASLIDSRWPESIIDRLRFRRNRIMHNHFPAISSCFMQKTTDF